MRLKEIFVLSFLFTTWLVQAQDPSPEEKTRPRFRAGLGYVSGPEVYWLRFPPLKISLDYYFNRERDFYLGLDGSVNVFAIPYGHVGLQAGYQDVSMNTYFECGVDLVTEEGNWHLTWNPKIGHDFPVNKTGGNIYLEAGPAFYLRRDPGLLEPNYVTIDPLPINIEVGFSGRF